MVTATERGIDTWRLARYLDHDRDVERARALMPAGRLPVKVAGHVVGFLPGHRMLWVEGHPAVEGLADPASLLDAQGAALDALEMAGVPVGRDAGVARLDGTVGLTVSPAREGLVLLAGLASLDVPRSKPVVYGKPPQTVYLQGERSSKLLARIYDKGIESGLAAAGHLLRFEDQRRFTKESRRAVSNVEPASDFERRFADMRRSADGVRAVTLPVLSRELAERVNSGELHMRTAERLVGHLVLEHAGATRGARRTLMRRRRELREHGLVIADDFFEPIEVNLADSLEAALAAWAD